MPAVLVIQPNEAASKDTSIVSGSSSQNAGAAITVIAGRLNSTNVYRGLIRFDISSIPVNATIVSAILDMRASAEDSATDYNVSLHRSLVEWYEGAQNFATPAGGEDASTWALRNHNGSVAWAGGAGGGSGSDYAASPTATTLITSVPTHFTWDVTSDVQAFVNGTYTNHGWWLIGDESVGVVSRKQFQSAGTGTASNRPTLTITYTPPSMLGSSSGTTTVTGDLAAPGMLRGAIAATATVTGELLTQEFVQGLGAGTSTTVAFLRAVTFVKGNSFGDTTTSARIKASYQSVGATAGSSTAIAHLKGRFNLSGLITGSGLLTATPSFRGQLRGATAGVVTVEAVGYARAVSVARIVGCNPVPLFYLTDGSVRANGQLNILNFLTTGTGYLLRGYKPQINQYKEGGRWSSSPQSNGRRLRQRVFDNAIDVLELTANAIDQDALIQYQQDLLSFQEAAADYWTSEYPLLPCYLVSRAAYETNTRYALVHMISCPELENPYDQPFFDIRGATFGTLTLRIERGMWLSTPPGKFDCVEISSRREWTVSGWQQGS